MQPLHSEIALSPPEAQRLHELEVTIREGFDAFLRVSAAFLELREGRLYRSTHETFQSCICDKWGLSLSRTRQIADTLSVYHGLTDTTPTQDQDVAPPEEACLTLDDYAALARAIPQDHKAKRKPKND